MTEGVVAGGWGFVWSAYALTFGAFAVYGVMLFAKLRAGRRSEAHEEQVND